MTPPWKIPLRDYLGPAPALNDAPHLKQDGMQALARMANELPDWPRVTIPQRPDLVFHVAGRSSAAVTDAKTGEILGGLAPLFPFVLPEHRGRNICAELHAIVDEMGLRGIASAYSRSGLGARAATHRLHVERALERGQPVPEEVLSDYHRDAAGRLRLCEPYTAEMHNEWVKVKQREARLKHHRETTADYVEVFTDPEDSRTMGAHDYDPGWKGYLLAIALHRELGSGFRVCRQDGICTVQAEIDGLVIDCDGVRPAACAIEDLQRRHFLGEEGGIVSDPFLGDLQQGEIVSSSFKSEADFLEWLGPGVEGKPGSKMPGFSEEELWKATQTRPGQRMLAAKIFQAEPAGP